MKKIDKDRVKKLLEESFGAIDWDCYLYDSIPSNYEEIFLPETTPMDMLIQRTHEVIKKYHEIELMAINDAIAGWRNREEGIHKDDFLLISTDEIDDLIKSHIFFRNTDGYTDNYYLINHARSIIIMFCHENDWHCWVRK